MTNDQLAGKYARLRQELAQAYGQPLSSATRSGLIERLAAELMELERRLALLQKNEQAPVGSQHDDAQGHESPRLAA
jgi:uncharacterized membrane protein YccC